MKAWEHVVRLELAGWASQWLRACKLQAERVSGPFTGDPYLAVHRQSDAVMFALSLANLERAAVAILGDQHTAVVTYRTLVPAGTHVRDMFSHFDEYAQGKGQLQADWVRKGVVLRPKMVEGFGRWFAHDGQNMTVVIGGMELNVTEALAAAEVLHAAAVEATEGDHVDLDDDDSDMAAADEVSPRYHEVGND